MKPAPGTSNRTTGGSDRTRRGRIVPEDFDDARFRVTGERPCPVCEKPDWCLSDGFTWALCQRIERGRRWKDSGWFHRLGTADGSRGSDAPATPRAKSLSEKPADATARPAAKSNTLWADKDAAAEFARLPLARDNADAARMFSRDYGIGDGKPGNDCIPRDWRLMVHPKLGSGVVYRGITPDGAAVYKFKSDKRNAKGKRASRFLFGDAEGAMILRHPDAAGRADGNAPRPWVVVAGEEKALAAFLAGANALSPLAGEKPITRDLARQLAELKPERICIMHDNDKAGRDANVATADALIDAGVPADNIATADWPADAPDGFDVNDAMKSGGTEAVRTLIDNATPAESGPRPLPFLTVDEIFEREIPPDLDLVGNGIISRGEITLMVGPPEHHKSRLRTNLALSILLKRTHWLDSLPIHQHDLRILIVQTEDNLKRTRFDLAANLRGCTLEERERVARNLRILIPESFEDRDLRLDNAETVARLRLAIRDHNPDLIIADPWADLSTNEDENSATQTRESVRLLRSVIHCAGERVACLLVHHARSGKAVAADADTWERGSFGRGSKVLLSIVRSQINIIPGDADGQTVVIACGKANNAPRFEPFAVRFDSDSGLMVPDPEFDFEQWRAEVKGSASGGPAITVDRVCAILSALGGQSSKAKLRDALMEECGCKKTAAYDAITRAIEAGRIQSAVGFLTLLPPDSASVPRGTETEK